MQLLVCVIRPGSEYRAIVSQCGRSRRASDRWGKLPLSLDMITAGGMRVCVCVCVCVCGSGVGEICVGVVAD